ncbi:MAG: hypothetical protein AAF525_15380 [Pseudomonadota bacterium]
MSLIKQLTGAMRPTVFLVTGLLIVPGSSFARVLDCDRLNGEQKAVCEDLAMCSLIGNGNAREQCVAAVLVSEQKRATVGPAESYDPQSAPVPSSPAIVAPAAAAETDQVIVKIRPRGDRQDQAVRVAPETDDEAGDDGKIPIRRLADLEIPRKFTATVASARHLLRNRQVILLDNDLLFDGEGHYEEGTEVAVVRKRLGGRYTMTHRHGNDEFDRVECERADSSLKREQRKWCNLFFESELLSATQ